MRIFSRIIGCLVIGFCLTAEVEAANVAVIAPKVGGRAKYGKEIIDGARFAVDVVNERGGLGGEKINLIEVDDRCEDSFAVSTAQMIALSSSKKDRIDLVVGPFCDNQFENVATIFDNSRIMQVVTMPLSGVQGNVKKRGLIKIGGLVSDQALAFFDMYNNQMAGQNVAVVYDGTKPKTTETALETQQLFRQNGLLNLTLFDFANYKNEYKQMAKEILLDSRIVYILGGPEDMARLAQRLQQEDKKTVIFVDEYLANGYFFREMGNFAKGVYVLALQDLKDSPNFAEELVELRLMGKEPKGLGVYGYTAVKLWSELVEEAKSVDFNKVVNKIGAGDFDLPWGKVQFEHGNVTKSGGYKVYQVNESEYAQAD